MIHGSFRRKIIGLVVVLLGVAQAATLAAVLLTTHRNVRSDIRSDLRIAEGVFKTIFESRFVQLGDSVRVLATDFGFKQAVATGDGPTILSAVENHAARAGAHLAMLTSLNGDIIATTGDPAIAANPDWRAAVDGVIRGDDRADTMSFDGIAYQFVAAPVTAPDSIAWLFMGFAVDDALANEFRHIAGIDVSFIGGDTLDLYASSLPAATRSAMRNAIHRVNAGGGKLSTEVAIDNDRYLTQFRPLGEKAAAVVAVLQKSLSEELAPYNELAIQLAGLSVAILGIAILGGTLVARGITEPVQQLARAAERIGEGNYATSIDVVSNDEVGALAITLNTMQSEIAERQQRIVHQAHHDDLTGLPNRWLANDRLNGAINRSKRSGKPFSVAMLDLSRFKQINDSLGHHVGDVALKEIARRLVVRARQSDTVARLGGDDFLLILEGCDVNATRQFLRELQSTLMEPIPLDNMRVSIDFHVGIATFPDHAERPEELVRRSEIAMYDAKATHTRVVLYEPGRDEGHLRQLAIVSGLPAALAANQLTLHYQPKADIASGEIRQAEALVRWIHPEFGFLPPDEFIAVIEQSGNISALTHWVIETAARQIREWRDGGLDIKVSINLSTLDLLNEELPETLQNAMSRYDLETNCLGLEITESAVMYDPKTSLKLLGRLRAAGFTLSIDDFGTGYSSLAQLKHLPVDELKIDKSFVMKLSMASEDAYIVKLTIDLARSMGLKVVAEGIENVEGWEALKAFGCETGQGYFISKPLSAEEFEEWLRVARSEGADFLFVAA